MSENISGRTYVQGLLVGRDQFVVGKVVIIAVNASVMRICVDEPIACFVKNGAVWIAVRCINTPLDQVNALSLSRLVTWGLVEYLITEVFYQDFLNLVVCYERLHSICHL